MPETLAILPALWRRLKGLNLLEDLLSVLIVIPRRHAECCILRLLEHLAWSGFQPRMSNAKTGELESHRIAQPQSLQHRDDDEEIFSDTRSQQSSPSQPSSPASTPGKERSSPPENGAKEAASSTEEPSSRVLADRRSGEESQASGFESSERKHKGGAPIAVDPGEEQVVVKDLDTGRSVTVQKV